MLIDIVGSWSVSLQEIDFIPDGYEVLKTPEKRYAFGEC
jgi:hypothetical protein